MTIEVARQMLFGESLSSDESRPAAVLAEWPDEHGRRVHLVRAEALLRALALLEDGRPDDAEEHGPTDVAVRRVEAKVDLLVSLVAGLIQRDRPADPLRQLQWSEHGMAVELAVDESTGLSAGGMALVRVALSDVLPQPLVLPVVVLAVEPSPAGRRVWLRFDSLTPALESLLGRHLFRSHRRHVAESRRQR